ncbi:unnamed protein product, partial [marine sediment metagenome]
MEKLPVLSESQIERIQEAMEDLLKTVGFRVMHEGILRQARAAGADVDEQSGTVRIPTPLLRQLLADCFALKGLLLPPCLNIP